MSAHRRHLLASILVGMGCQLSAASAADVEKPATAADLPACADRLVASFRSEHGIPGVSVAVVRRDALVYRHSAGLAHVELSVVATPSTLFQLSSTAKLFTGVLAMRLAEQGKLQLDDSVTRYLPDAPAGWKPVTLRHCLNHTSGLAEVTDLPGVRDGTSSAAQALEALYVLSPAPKPGERFSYCNSGFMLIQRIGEVVTKQDFEPLVRAEILGPAGMLSTRYWASPLDVLNGAATGYHPTDAGTLRHREYWFPRYLWAAGGLASSVEDLVRFQAALADGRLLSEAAVARLWEPVRLSDGSTVSYGLGWDTKTHAPGMRSAGHEGGMLTTFRVYPEVDITVIVLASGFLREFNPDDFATALAAIWEPRLIGYTEPACDVSRLEDAQF